MNPSLLVVANALGIIWADQEFFVPRFLVVILSSAGVLVACLPNPEHLGSQSSRSARRTGCVILLMLLSGLVGFMRLDNELKEARLDQSIAEAADPTAIRRARAFVKTRRSLTWGDEVELEGVVAIDHGPPVPHRLLLRLTSPDKQDLDKTENRADRLLWPGEWVQLGIRIRALHGSRNPGTSDREKFRARRGLAAQARLVDPDWIIALARPGELTASGMAADVNAILKVIARARVRWRQEIAARFEAAGESAGIVRALGIGDRTGMTRETRDAFRRLGLSHLLAISGLHVAFLAALVAWPCTRAAIWAFPKLKGFESFEFALIASFVAILFYAWVTGGGTSVQRAGIVFGCYAVCRACRRVIRPFRILSWAALAILVANPASLFDLGTELSFAACGALIASGLWSGEASPEPDKLANQSLLAYWSNLARSILRTSLVVSLGTAPILLQHGFALPTMAPIFNLIAIPWTGFLVLPTSLFAVSTLRFLSNTLIRALIVPSRILEVGAVQVAQFIPEAREFGLFSIPVTITLVGAAFIAMRRGHWKKAWLAWIIISLAGGHPIALGGPNNTRPRIIFFDVGQGDAALIQGHFGTMLIDTGPGPMDGSGGKGLVRALRTLDVHQIDVLILTHADLDHRGGILRILESFEVKECWFPDVKGRDEELLKVAQAGRAYGCRILWQNASSDARATIGDLGFEILWPRAVQSDQSLSRNDQSLVIRITMDGVAILMTADIGASVETALLKSNATLNSAILKAGHHGSRHSSTSAFIARVGPEMILLSAPCDSTRGLPNGLAYQRLRESDAAIWWTGRDGAVMVSPANRGSFMTSSWGARRHCQPR